MLLLQFEVSKLYHQEKSLLYDYHHKKLQHRDRYHKLHHAIHSLLLQFVLSNKFIDVALAGMRTPEEVDSSCRVWRDLAGRIDIDALWGRYVLGSRQP